MILFINRNKILSKIQFGFQANRSTSHALIHLTDLITSYLDKSERVAGVFLDISKTLSVIIFSCKNCLLMAFEDPYIVG